MNVENSKYRISEIKGGVEMSLRIFFDFSCPYCYLAWGFVKKLKSSIPIEDEWITWQIFPNAPQEGLTIQNIKPDIDLTARRQKLNDLGEPVGLMPGQNEFLPNTRWALEIGEFARENHKMHEWIDKVYHASFVEGKNIGNQVVLFDLAKQIGFSDEEIRDVLDSGRYTDILLKHDQECVVKKIEWVPTIFNKDEKILEGAFTFSVFEEIIRSQFAQNVKNKD